MPATIRPNRLRWLCAAILLIPASLIAQAPDRVDVATLNSVLLAISSPTPDSFRQAEQAWARYEGATTDILAKYAMALALARNNRHQAAFDLLEGVPPIIRQAGPLRRLRIWLLVKLRKDEQGEAELETLVTELKTRAANPPTANDFDDVQFLYKLVTHLERIDDRPDHLTRRQAEAWRTALEGLPPAWQRNLAAHQESVLTEFAERERKVQDTYQVWRTKTEKELADTKTKLANLSQQETTTKQQLAADTAAHENYVKQFGPQIAALEAKAAPLIEARNALRKPVEPRKQSTSGIKDRAQRDKIERENDRREREYDRELDDYKEKRDRIINALAPLERQAAPLYAQDRALRAKVEQLQAALDKIQKPLGLQTKNEQRLTKILGDQPTWETAGNLASLRALEAYSILSFSDEVDRITRTRNK